jgi:hypothetical protein
VTDQPSSQPSSEEPDGDAPAALAPDDVPTQVSSPEPAAAGPAPSAAPEPPTPPAAFAPSGTTAPPPPASPPSDAEPPSGEDASAGPGGLAAAFPPERPERALGAAFAGGLALALILKRLAR